MSILIELPEILDIPEKLYPFIFDFDKFNYHLLEGGRGGGKSHSVARFICWLAEQNKIRVCCGREVQNTINESVKTIFETLISKFNLNFEIKKDYILHRKTGSYIFFRGFREQGRINIKGLEGIDILWIDEAQAITKPTLDYIIPTIRKDYSRVIFTMNRFVRNDPAFKFCNGRNDVQHIKINFYDNKHCPQKLKDEAKRCKEVNYADYLHIWEGEPLAQSNDFLFNSHKIDEALQTQFNDEKHPNNSVLSVDLAASGADLNVAKYLVQKSRTGWEEEKTFTWSEPDTDITKGKIINLYSVLKPDILIIDADGLGYSIFVSIKNAIPSTIGFRGAQKAKQLGSGNQRADGYLATKDFIQNGWLKLNCENAARQLEYIKRVYKPSGLTFIQSKKDIRKEQDESPDYADSLMMGIYAITYHSDMFIKENQTKNNGNYTPIKSDFDPFAD